MADVTLSFEDAVKRAAIRKAACQPAPVKPQVKSAATRKANLRAGDPFAHLFREKEVRG